MLIELKIKNKKYIRSIVIMHSVNTESKPTFLLSQIPIVFKYLIIYLDH